MTVEHRIDIIPYFTINSHSFVFSEMICLRISNQKMFVYFTASISVCLYIFFSNFTYSLYLYFYQTEKNFIYVQNNAVCLKYCFCCRFFLTLTEALCKLLYLHFIFSQSCKQTKVYFNGKIHNF